MACIANKQWWTEYQHHYFSKSVDTPAHFTPVQVEVVQSIFYLYKSTVKVLQYLLLKHLSIQRYIFLFLISSNCCFVTTNSNSNQLY